MRHMTLEEEYEEARKELKRILSLPPERFEEWANNLLDKAIRRRKRP